MTQYLLEQGYFSDAVPLPYYLQDIMQTECEQWGCPYTISLAVAEIESHFDVDAVGGVGEAGIMQLNPGPSGSYHTALKAATGQGETTPEDVKQASRRERKRQWGVKGKARVSHPLRGEIVVPCASSFAALLCAAEVRRCNWIDKKTKRCGKRGKRIGWWQCPLHYIKERYKCSLTKKGW